MSRDAARAEFLTTGANHINPRVHLETARVNEVEARVTRKNCAQ